MLKKIFTILTIFLLVSCQFSKKSKDSSEEFNIEEEIIDDKAIENAEPYQTIDNEQEAEEITQQEAEQIEEIEVQDRVFFGYDSSTLNDEAKKILDTQVIWLKSDGEIKITIEGHCDERGTREYNIALGEKRANSVKQYLVKNGISSSRIKTISYGKERPAYFGATNKIFSKNRRAVTIIN